MPLLEWSEKTISNIEEWDTQHKAIIEQLTSICTTSNDGNHQNVVRQTYNLLSYLNVHFRYEEELMRLYGYPDHAIHKSKHTSISQKLLNFTILYSGGKKYVAANIAPIFNMWLEDHLEGEDKKLAEYLKSKRVT